MIGAISLRTRGVYFIMITLAFGQMLFYLANSIKGYGGDEGLNIRARSLLGFGLDLKDANDLLLRRPGRARGDALRPARASCARASAAPWSRSATTRCAPRRSASDLPPALAVFVAAGAVAGVAGALSVNQQGYVSPNLLHWTQSGTLMVMVILGGVASLWGGVLGAAVLVILQETLSAYTRHWEFWTGWVLLAVVLFARHGLAGWLAARRARGGR